jgi:hypothetical protein
MGSAVQKSSSNRQIILFEVLLGFVALLFFLLFSASTGKAGYPDWYSWGTALLEIVSFLAAAILCLRNAFSPLIVSGRRVWLGIGLGMLFYFIGNLFFTYWENVLGREPDISPGDIFYVASYICLIISMSMAAFERRLNLEGWQYGVIAAVGVVGTVIAILLAGGDSDAKATMNQFNPLNPLSMPPAIATTMAAPAAPGSASGQFELAQAAPKVPAKKPAAAVKPVAKPTASPAATVAEPSAPAWVIATEKLLQPFKGFLSFLYLIADTVLLIIATTLFLAFWGGRFAQSWRLIAAATLCLYLADAWFKFATTRLENYQSGGLLEVGWILSAVLFGIGATLEYELSQSRRSSGRRRGMA